MRSQEMPGARRRRSRLPLGVCVTCLLAISLSACATRGPSAVPGQRVQLSGARVLPEGTRVSRVVGELARRDADTVWLRVAPASTERAFLVRASQRLDPRMPTRRTDPWLLGDSLREARVVAGGRNGWEYWAVAAAREDGLVIEHARTETASRYRPLRPDPTTERQVRRVRAGGRILGGLALIAAGALPLLLIDNDPEPTNSLYPDIDGTTLVVGAIAGGIIGSGVALIFSAFAPRPGWDPVPDAELPPLRRSSGPTVGIGVRIGAGP